MNLPDSRLDAVRDGRHGDAGDGRRVAWFLPIRFILILWFVMLETAEGDDDAGLLWASYSRHKDKLIPTRHISHTLQLSII